MDHARAISKMENEWTNHISPFPRKEIAPSTTNTNIYEKPPNNINTTTTCDPIQSIVSKSAKNANIDTEIGTTKIRKSKQAIIFNYFL